MHDPTAQTLDHVRLWLRDLVDWADERLADEHADRQLIAERLVDNLDQLYRALTPSH